MSRARHAQGLGGLRWGGAMHKLASLFSRGGGRRGGRGPRGTPLYLARLDEMQN